MRRTRTVIEAFLRMIKFKTKSKCRCTTDAQKIQEIHGSSVARAAQKIQKMIHEDHGPCERLLHGYRSRGLLLYVYPLQ